MSADLIIRGVNLADGQTAVDLIIDDGVIKAIGTDLDAAGQTIDAPDCLLTQPFADSHFHMDATLSLGLPRLNQSGTLLEGIQLWGELKPLLTEEAVIGRALDYCDMATARGIQAIRSHVDVCDPNLTGVKALLQVRELIKDRITLQLVAFPQDGLYRYPGARDLLLQALDMGVDMVGGIPHFERTMDDGARSVRDLCEIAKERGLMVDMHCDETDDPHSRHIETLAFETTRLDLGGRVAGSHLTSMHSMDNYYVSKLIPLIHEAGVAAIANPLINIQIQGRHDTYPKRRGLTRIKELQEAGITVAFGHDCVMDPWYSMGSGDMLEVASMAIHCSQLTSRAQMLQCFKAVTEEPAKIMGLNAGIAVGKPANFVILDAADAIEAIRLRATRLYCVREGKVIAKTPKVATQLNVTGRPNEIDLRHRH